MNENAIETEAWVVWQYECPHCKEIAEVYDEFDSDRRCETECEHCRKPVVVTKP